MKIFLFLCLLVINITAGYQATYAQGVQKPEADPVSFLPASGIDSLLNSGLDSVVKAKGSPLLSFMTLGKNADNLIYMIGIRASQGLVEMHETWDDVAIIRSGHGILKTGYRVSGDRKEVQLHSGNWLGGVIESPVERKLSPGDFIIIPAALAHQYIPAPGENLVYWTIKVKHPKS